ncbi:MAG: hypothetical protein Q9191_001984 [Dirinaria sp. TL-2023a]
MSDPLSVAAGVIGIVTAAVQVSKVLIDFTNGMHDAPRQATVVLEKVNSIHIIMSQLQPFVLGLATPDQSRSCLIQVDAVIAILTGCVATFSELEQVLDGLRAEGLATFLDKIKWTKKESTIASLIMRLETHESSLSLMLNILNGNTMQEVKVSVNRLNTTMNEKYQEILDRLRSLELRQSVISRPASRSSTVFSERPSSEARSQKAEADIEGNEGQAGKTFNLKFERDLAITRVYRKTLFPGSTSSLLTTEEEPQCNWSMLSALSMADMASQISVLNLAISASDVYNSNQYTEKSLDKFLDKMDNNQQNGEEPKEGMEKAMKKFPHPLQQFIDGQHKAEDPAAEVVIVAAFETLGLPAPLSSKYALYMIHENPQKELGYAIDSRYKYFWKRLEPTEKPLRISRDWVRKGRQPIFMIRRPAGPFVNAQGITRNSMEQFGYHVDGWLIDAEAFYRQTRSSQRDSGLKCHGEEFYIPAMKNGGSTTNSGLRYVRATSQESCREVLRRALEQYNIPSLEWGRYRLAILDNREVRYLSLEEKPLALFSEGRNPIFEVREIGNGIPAYHKPEIDQVYLRSKARIWSSRLRKVPYTMG